MILSVPICKNYLKSILNSKSKPNDKSAIFTQEILALLLKYILSKTALRSETKHVLKKDESEYELFDKRNFNKEEFVTEG